MKNLFLSLAEAADLIATGAVVFASGSEESLKALPRGKWIGGTTAYFMAEDGGVCRDDKVFCTVFDEALDARTAILPADRLARLTQDRFAHGFACIVAPAFSTTHQRYAVEGPALPGLYNQPVFGWVAGVRLDRLEVQTPKVVDGATGQMVEDGLATLWVELPPSVEVDLDIVNLFTAGEGDVITFSQEGFTVANCEVNGQSVNFAHYVTENKLDTRLPLVADYSGAMINVSFRAIDPEAGQVSFYAPVVPGAPYRLAKPVLDHGRTYSQAGSGGEAGRMLSCNCILNYLYDDLEGRSAGGFLGPVTFGEFAYILLNQTLSRLTVTHPAVAREAVLV